MQFKKLNKTGVFPREFEFDFNGWEQEKGKYTP